MTGTNKVKVRQRPQSARPAGRMGFEDDDETVGGVANLMETRNIRDTPVYKSPDVSRREPTSRPMSAPAVRDFIPGLLLPTASVDPASALSSDRRPAVEQTSAARLPIQTRLCGLLERRMSQSRTSRFREQGLHALAQARGPHGDWSDCTHEQMQGLAKMLAHGECAAELTQMVSELSFLQRRLAVSSRNNLLADIDICQDALMLLIQRERFELRYSFYISLSNGKHMFMGL